MAGLAAAGIALACSTSPAEPANPATGMVRRLTETQYRATIADIFGPDILVAGRFEPDLRVEGLLAAGTSAVSLTPSGAERYSQLARGIAEQVVDTAHRDKLVGCAPGPADPDGVACARAFFSNVGLKLYRRPLTSAELALRVKQTTLAKNTLHDFHAALGMVLSVMLTDMPFLFQVDRDVPNPADRGQRVLDGWSRASKLSYFLWNTTPDDALLRAAADGSLMTPQGLAAQTDRMIASPRFEAGVRSFFDDFLQLDGLQQLSKDAIIYPAFRTSVAPAAREQTLRTVIALLVTENGDYRDLFTTNRVAINRQLSPIYRMAYAPHDWSVVTMPEGDPRVGLLTQISFLALHSHEGRTSPTLRGKALREILMCESVPTPPANVNFTILQDTTNPNLRTTRARLTAHLDDETCASCHKFTDPMGLTLDRFDGAGQYRATENGVSIDTSGVLDQVHFADAAGLWQALHDHPQVPRCLAQSVWRYASGRALTRADTAVTNRLDQGFAASGYRLRALFRQIVTDPAFVTIGQPSVPGAGHAMARSK